MMATAAMWIAISAASALCTIFIAITNYISKRLLKETSIEAGIDDQSQCPELMRDALGDPIYSRVLCAVIGVGFQNLSTVVSLPLVIMFYKFEMDVRILMVMVMSIYLIHGSAAGYVAVLLYKTMKGRSMSFSADWIKVSWPIAFISCWTYFSMKGIVKYESVQMTLCDVQIVALWMCISMPISLLGGYCGAHAMPIHLPILMAKATGDGSVRGKNQSWVLILLLGSFTLLICSFETSSLLINSWHTSPCMQSVFLLIAAILIMVSACNGLVVLISVMMSLGKCCWWSWKPFFVFGCPLGLYVILRTLAFSNFRSGSFSEILALSLSEGLFTMITIGTLGFILMFISYRPVFTEP